MTEIDPHPPHAHAHAHAHIAPNSVECHSNKGKREQMGSYSFVNWLLNELLGGAFGGSPVEVGHDELVARGVRVELRDWPRPWLEIPEECSNQKKKVDSLSAKVDNLGKEMARITKTPGQKDEHRELSRELKNLRKDLALARTSLDQCLAIHPPRTVVPDYATVTKCAITLVSNVDRQVVIDIDDYTEPDEAKIKRLTQLNGLVQGSSTTAVFDKPGAIYRLTFARSGFLDVLYQAYRINWHVPTAKELIFYWDRLE
jgi:hypothetical protein